jgi:hypothetical protein
MSMKRWRRGGLIVLSMVIGACAQLGQVLDDTGQSDVVDGEIWSVDTRGSSIDVRPTRGNTVTLRYDRNTRVIYEQREYDPSALEQGDRVRALTSRDRNGTLWADRVDVLESVRDGDSGQVGQIERIAGTFGRYDPNRDYFTLVVARETLYVDVPRDVRAEDLTRLERLRSGDQVRLDLRLIGRDEMELVRFR